MQHGYPMQFSPSLSRALCLDRLRIDPGPRTFAALLSSSSSFGSSISPSPVEYRFLISFVVLTFDHDALLPKGDIEHRQTTGLLGILPSSQTGFFTSTLTQTLTHVLLSGSLYVHRPEQPSAAHETTRSTHHLFTFRRTTTVFLPSCHPSKQESVSPSFTAPPPSPMICSLTLRPILKENIFSNHHALLAKLARELFDHQHLQLIARAY